MKTIHIIQAFVLRLTEGVGDAAREVTRRFDAGLHTVEDDVAGHWFVKAHTGDAPALDALAAERADLVAKQAELVSGQSALAASMKALQDAQAQLDADRAALAAESASKKTAKA
jgi:hypothetical protein